MEFPLEKTIVFLNSSLYNFGLHNLCILYSISQYMSPIEIYALGKKSNNYIIILCGFESEL